MTDIVDRLRGHVAHLTTACDHSDRVILEDLAAAARDICEALVTMATTNVRVPATAVTVDTVPDLTILPGVPVGQFLRLDLEGSRAFWRGKLVILSRRQVQLLKLLTDSPGRVFTLGEMHAHCREVVTTMTVSKLRRKFKAVDPLFAHLRNGRHVGYYWDVD